MADLKTTLTDATLAEQARRKELGYASHFLDAVWDNLGKTAAIAVGLTAAGAALMGDVPSAMIPASLLAGLVPAALQGLSRLRDAAELARAYDGPAVQDFVGRVAGRAAGAVASRRGTVWIVREPGAESPSVMGEREYARYRRDVVARGLPLDEVLVTHVQVSVSRLLAGRLDPAGRDLPASERLDLGSGRTERGWFLFGRRAKPAAVAAAAGPAYKASRFLSGGSGMPVGAAATSVRAPARPAYSASRFLSGGSGHEDEDALPVPGR